jgi:ERCC4-type nuclease
MSNLTQTELAKIRKASLHSVSLSSELKTSVVDVKLRELAAEIKKVLAKNGMTIEIFVMTTGAI